MADDDDVLEPGLLDEIVDDEAGLGEEEEDTEEDETEEDIEEEEDDEEGL